MENASECLTLMGLCNILAMKLAYLEEMALCYKFHTTQQGIRNS